LREREADLDELVKARNRAKNYNPGGSWRLSKTITQNDCELLQVIKQARDSLGENVKVRIEDPYVQFYSAEEQLLQNLAQQIQHKQNDHFFSWMCPADQQAQDVLLQGKVIRKRPLKYQYKVVIRDGKYSEQTRSGLKNWLQYQEKEHVHAPKALIHMLSSNHRFIWGGYIYVNDLRTATLIGLIDPGLVSKIEEFHYAGFKE
jgi:hypothetical protein